MDLVDARRLTGPNLLARSPLVIVEIALGPEEDRATARASYLAELGRMRRALGLRPEVSSLERPHHGGTVIAYAEPIDVMLACTEMSEWAGLSACEIMAGRAPLPLTPKRDEIEAMLERDRSPRLRALEGEAARRGIPLLWDDESISLGLGCRSVTFRRDSLPESSEVLWETLGRIPVALVTGTNGKTTSTRLLARIAREAGKHVGSTSSDGVVVGDEVLERGDWTGPAAARIVLRRPDVEFAVLETARGGILRRGLAIDWCDAALLTNVTDDHVGGYGIDDLDAMARVKAVTLDAVAPAGHVVVNAHDPRVVALAQGRKNVVYFADLEGRGETEVSAFATRHRDADFVYASGGRIVHARAGEKTALASIADIPITFGGAARFNVENALGAAATAIALGLPEDAIVRGLVGFTPADNPRRSMLLDHRGVSVVLDFGHNPEGVRAVLALVASLRKDRGGRLTLITGSPGDRSDREIAEIARALWEARPNRVILRELGAYLRGRALGEVPELFRRALLGLGMDADAIALADSEAAALRQALEAARPGDFVVLLVHLEHDQVRAILEGA